jgi:hypothetical protein
LIKLSRTIAGARVSAAAAGPPPPSSPLRRSSELRRPPSIFPRPHGSFSWSVWLSPAPVFTPFEFPRPRLRCSAGAAHRRHPRPILLHQSFTGEPNRRFPSLVCLPVPHLAAGELAIAVGSKGGAKGIFVKDLKVLGSCAQRDSSLLCSLVSNL